MADLTCVRVLRGKWFNVTLHPDGYARRVRKVKALSSWVWTFHRAAISRSIPPQRRWLAGAMVSPNRPGKLYQQRV